MSRRNLSTPIKIAVNRQGGFSKIYVNGQLVFEKWHEFDWTAVRWQTKMIKRILKYSV